jgi:hypothetical protein
MKRRKEVLLELTPLLDVILIMLFYILMQSTQAADARQEEADLQVGAMQEQLEEVLESAEAAAAEAESREGALESQYEAREQELTDELTYINELLGSYEIFETYAQILTVYVSNGQDGMRIIHVSDGQTDENISYGWDDLRYARNSLKDVLMQKCSEGQEAMPVFLVFHYRDDVIYRQDYQLVTEVMEEAARGQSHVYIRLIDEEKEE